MSTTVTPLTPQGNVPAINVPASQDYARLVFAAPYFDTIPIAEILEPSVLEACESLLPGLVPPFVTDAAQQAVQDLAVLLAGSTMSGPLFLNGLPTQPTQAADKQYVDMMVATSGVPEVPTVPTGQVWGRTTGQWVPIASAEGTFLPLSGGTMGGIINMGGNAINNLPAVPNLPNGAAPAQWVLNSIAASSLYQGTWDVDTYQPDLTQPQYHQNNFSWIAITTTAGVVVSPPIPGLQGMTIYNGDTIIYSAQAGGVFQAIHAGGLSLPEADARYLQLAGGQMGGALLLFEDPVQNMEAATRQWVLAQVAAGGIPEAPTDGQIYGRNGNIRDWMPVVGLGGATLTGPLSLAGNAATAMQAVPLQQLQSSLGSYVPLIGNVTITGPITMTGVSSNLTLNSNASANLQAVPLQQLTSTLGSYLTSTAAASTYLALAGGTLTGPVTLSGNATAALNPVSLQQLQAGYLPLSGGTLTGPLTAPSLICSGTGDFGPNSPYPAGGAMMQAQNPGGMAGLFAANSPNVGGTTMLVRYDRLDGSMITFNFGTTACGNIESTTGNSVSYNTTSDGRLKTNVAPLTGSGDIIDALTPITFNWLTDATNAPASYGFVAQDTKGVFSGAVTEGSGTPGDEDFRPWMMDSGKFMPVAIAELKSLRARVAALEAHPS